MTDIVERLRNRALAAAIIKDKPDLYNDAADAIIRLCERLAEADECNRRVSDENEKLREALIGLYKPVFENPVEVGSDLDLALRVAAAAIRESEAKP